MSCITESIAPINPKINPEKYEYPYQVEELIQVGRFHHKKPNELIYVQFVAAEYFKSRG
jgi:hypothetical protein